MKPKRTQTCRQALTIKKILKNMDFTDNRGFPCSQGAFHGHIDARCVHIRVGPGSLVRGALWALVGGPAAGHWLGLVKWIVGEFLHPFWLGWGAWC